MTRTLKFIAVTFICAFLLRLAAFAGTEPYENFIKGRIKRNDTLIVKDEKFNNAKFNWGDITNISVKDFIALRITDEALLTKDFSCQLKLKVEYLSSPGQLVPEVKNIGLNVNYSVKKGSNYKITDSYSFAGAYWIRVTVENIYSPEYGNDLPAAFQLSSHIVIDRQYRFRPHQGIRPNVVMAAGLDNTSQAAPATGFSASHKSKLLMSLRSGASGSSPATGLVNGGNQLQLTWSVISGAEEYDIEWTTVNNGNPYFSTVQQMAAGTAGNVSPVILGKLFLHNASRITTHDQAYLLSLVYNDDYILVRMRQVQYAADGTRLLGDWDYRQDNNSYAAWALNWYQDSLNWQYSASFAEEGKKKEVVSYFDGSLRGRQTVTINNSDNVAVVQENIYDEFGRPTASILPAPVKESGSGNPYLHYFKDFNLNANDSSYNAANIKGAVPAASCEFNPDPLKTSSGASLYYSPQNPFMGDKNYNKYIPDAEGFPLSVNEYTADNTGRMKVQGGVGKVFQPGNSYPSKTTKFYYGKPEQWELDQLFGNDVGFASHYLKNMTVDPNGQASISYVNASGKTIATALTGPAPAGMDSLSSIVPAQYKAINLLDQSKFAFDNSALKISATTTYLAAISGDVLLNYNVEKLVDQYPGGAKAICSNCYYDLRIKIVNDCNSVVYSTTTPIQIGARTADCNDHGYATNSFTVNFPQIGEYYISFELAFSKTVMENYVDQFVIKGQQNGALRKEFSFILPYLDSIDFKGCLSDCKTCVKTLGLKNDFISLFSNRLTALDVDSASVQGTAFQTWVNAKYDYLKVYCDSLAATCNLHPSVSPCDQYEKPMLDDVSPGGQYALFDKNGVALEPATNVISANWRTQFPVLASGDSRYQAELITLPDGSITSPYDASFTLPQLVEYWKASWAFDFLQYHPEYCKLQFCIANASFKSWDQQVQDDIDKATDIAAIPNAPAGFQYDHANGAWLLSADPFFQTGAPGASFKGAIQNDLLNYSLNVANNQVSTVKSLTGFVDYLTYCGDVNGNTNTSNDPNNNWDNCSPTASCRVPDREWSSYKELYFSLKDIYYEKLRATTTCAGACPVGTPLALPPNNPCPVPSDFTIAAYSAVDGPPTSQCPAPQQTISLSYVPGKLGTAVTVTIAYPAGTDISGLQTVFQFAAGQGQQTFCMPEHIPVQGLSIQSIVCPDCLANPLLFNSWNNAHIVQKTFDSNNQLTGTTTLQPGSSSYFYGTLTIRPDNTYDVAGDIHNYSANWEMDPHCNFALYSNGVKYTLYSVTDHQLVLGHREGNTEETWYFDGTADLTVCSNPVVVEAVSVAGHNTFFSGTFPQRHLLTVIPGTAGSQPVFNGTNALGQAVAATATFYTCLSIHQANNTTVNRQNVWLFDALYDTAPNSCPAVLLVKESRFNEINRNIITGDVTSEVQQNKDKVVQQVQSSCEANADGWMATLRPGLSGYATADTTALRAKLIEICAAGGDLDHPFGASTLPPGQLSASGYASFGDAIKGTLHIGSFTSQLNPWLIGSPYPYTAKQQSSPMSISASSSDICDRLQQLQGQKDAYNAAHGSSLSLFDYLTQLYGTAMSLSAADLATLQNSCTQCRFLLAYDMILPVFMQPGTSGCVMATDYTAAKADLQTGFPGGLATTDPNYQLIFTNFMNQRWGFVLTYDQYMDYEAALAASPGKILCNQVGAAAAQPVNTFDCIAGQMAAEVANGKRDYLAYIEEQKNLFRASYISTCSAAQANLNLFASQKVYHYTLYYYDQADNLVRTVPPEGVSLLDESAFPAVDNYRQQFAVAADYDVYDHSMVHTDKPSALDSLSKMLAAKDTAGRSIEMWFYNNHQNGNQLVATTPDHKILFQTCVHDTLMSVDVYKLDSAATNSVSILAASHYTVSVAKQTPFTNWQHVVLTSGNFLTDTIKAYYNGKLMPAVSGAPYAGCGLNIGPGGLAANVPDNFGTLKHLRMYNRIMDSAEVYHNATNPYFLPTNDTAMYWYRANIPDPNSVTSIDNLNTDEFAYAPVFPNHRMPTTYAYNSTNQVNKQQSPDGGINRYWYDLLSRLVTSQNDKQLPNNDYSYTVYEPLGKITEVGQKKQTAVNLGNPDYLSDSTYNAFLATGTNVQITNTYYDMPAPATNGIQSVSQDNLRKRVAASTYRDTEAGPVQQATYYNYDLDGNVKTLYQQIAGLELKRIDYEYDLVSGKVNFVSYQKNQPDQFYYDYNYDAENRLTEAWTSPLADINATGRGSQLDPDKKRMDASYQYYLHGPLARYELGDINNKVQGIDHAYTLQGWVKGVNRTVNAAQPALTTDIGNDGANGVGQDAFSYNLYYYPNDYKPIGGVNPFDKVLETQPDFYPLYNGNIAGIAQNLPAIGQPPMLNTYRYDQLNRITGNIPHENTLPGTLTVYDGMNERFSYDGNGNIKTAFRQGDAFAAPKAMDDLSYNYNRDGNGNLVNNKLRHVNDAVPYNSADNPQDLHDQVTDNYQYDPIGNLVKDQQANIANIDWTVYGKIKGITKTEGPSVAYNYDPAGQRASKTVNGLTTWYVRDTQGNTLAVYDNKQNQVNWREQNLYGRSRLGTWEPNVNLSNNNAATVWDTIGHKQYELSNHLGNVLATITDKRLAHSSNGTTIDYYEPEATTAQEYFAFGALIPKRSFDLGKAYRYGFNGKENDNDIGKGIGNQQDYGMRIYDPRVGRFLSVDPLSPKYPDLTPYQFGSNRPIDGIDLDGLEWQRFDNSYTSTIVYPLDRDATIEREYQAALHSKMNVMTAEGVYEVNKQLELIGKKFDNIIFSGHGTASVSSITMGDERYTLDAKTAASYDNAYPINDYEAQLKKLGSFVKEGGMVVLLGCFQATPVHNENTGRYWKDGNPGSGEIQIRMNGDPLVRKLSQILGRTVLACQGENYSNSNIFSGTRSLSARPGGDHYYNKMAALFYDKWEIIQPNGNIYNISGTVTMNQQGQPNFKPVETPSLTGNEHTAEITEGVH
ncbi:RHS repeat-associated core domain-containing protein [Mucilaginibacter sp. AW1-7]|uniref:RHS repeat-associated core domain-containing protein n=1 Tax=Mucilaginibacter sp. AW1-7 TaxID=3349874 RepID=UPI003F73A2A6